MDNFGGNSDYGLKLLLGTIIGIIIILFLVPLGANIIATEEVSSAANDAFNTVGNAHGSSDLVIPIDTANFVGFVDINVTDNSTNNFTTVNNLNINSSANVTNNLNNTEVNDNVTNSGVNNENITENTTQNDNPSIDVSSMRILSGTISTGSGLNDKSICTVYVGSEYAGENIKISTLYSRDGSNLNSGRIVAKTVDSSGYVTLRAADSYELYPSNCIVTLYDSNGNELDSRSVSLQPSSGTQSF